MELFGWLKGNNARKPCFISTFSTYDLKKWQDYPVILKQKPVLGYDKPTNNEKTRGCSQQRWN
jgi:hypothetical protein